MRESTKKTIESQLNFFLTPFLNRLSLTCSFLNPVINKKTLPAKNAKAII